MAKPIAVLAGSKQQYDQWLRDSGLGWRDAIYIDTWEKAAGVEFSRIEKVGTWYEQKHSAELYDRVRARVR